MEHKGLLFCLVIQGRQGKICTRISSHANQKNIGNRSDMYKRSTLWKDVERGHDNMFGSVDIDL